MHWFMYLGYFTIDILPKGILSKKSECRKSILMGLNDGF